jgi:secreted trypsin-like serine protease
MMLRILGLLLTLPVATAIFGGVTTLEGQFPYFVDIRPGDGRLNHCGGALVAPDLVLTHPQCAPLDLEAHIGWYSTSNQGEVLNFFSKDTLPAFVHPLYDKHSFKYGFMLVKLQSPSSQSFLKLNSDPSVPDSNTKLDVMGRGNRQDVGQTNTGQINLGKPQNRLDGATLPYIPTEECENARSLGDFTYSDTIADSLFCAGSDDYGACEDDWGSPIVIKNADPSEHLLVGIFAWTYGCRPTPSVFSRISSGYDWLRWTICQNSANAPAYLNCQSAIDPQIGQRLNPPDPPNPINFRWTFEPDDYYYENCKLETLQYMYILRLDRYVFF